MSKTVEMVKNMLMNVMIIIILMVMVVLSIVKYNKGLFAGEVARILPIAAKFIGQKKLL